MQDEKNVRPDFAKLPESSALYQPEDRRTTKEKLKTMDTEHKISFIVEYYGINILVVAFLIVVALFLVIHFAFSKDTAFSILAVNTSEDGNRQECPADDEAFYTDFLEDNGVDLSKSEMSVNASLGVSKTGEDSASETNLQTIMTRFMAGSVDVFFANEELFYSVGEFGYLTDLREYLPEDVIEKYRDNLLYVKEADGGKTYPAGIKIPGDNPWLQESGWYKQGTVIGIQDHAKHGKLCSAFIMQVLGEDQKTN